MRQVDIAVSGPDGKLQLVVEVKHKVGASAEWVTHLHRNLLVHSFMPPAPFFLLVLPDFLHLWTEAKPVNDLAEPDYTIDSDKVLAPYLKSNQSPNGLSGFGLGLLATSWLNDLVRADLHRDSVGVDSHWLFDSGLYEAIAHGSVELEAAT